LKDLEVIIPTNLFFIRREGKRIDRSKIGIMMGADPIGTNETIRTINGRRTITA
jgi:hypothetical protein